MKSTDIFFRDIRAACDLRHFGASIEAETVTIWRSDSESPIAKVKPGFSGGRSGHFIEPANGLIYAGTWECGMTCFDYANNRVVWHRADLIGIQMVDLSAGFPSSVFLTLEAPDYRVDEPGVFSGMVELDSRDGSTKWMTNQGGRLYLHPQRPLFVIEDRRDDLVRILDGTKSEVGSVPMIYFAILDVGFGENMIALAEGAEGVRILDFSGRVISRYVTQGRKPNCIRVSFNEGRVIVFDSWEGSFVSIIDPLTGKLIGEYERECHGDICFIDGGSRFVDSYGKICESTTGLHVATLKTEVQGIG